MTKWIAAVCLILAVTTIDSVYSKNLPSFITPCKRKDPNLNKCLLAFMDTLLKRAPKGIPELNVPPLEPFVVPQISLEQGSSKAVRLTATFNNMAVSGITMADIKEVKTFMEPEPPRFELVASIPSLRLQSDYIVDGQLLVVPIKGSGKADTNLTAVGAVLKVNTKLVDKKGNAHMDLEKIDVEIDVKNAQFYFDNLFEGNKELGETTNSFINQNWQELYEELRPVIADALGGVVQYILKIVLDEYSYNEIFPEK